MPLNVKCKNCNNYRNDWCEKVIDSPDPDMERDCRHFWEKTNADRIRAGSDEELVELLYNGIDDEYCRNDPMCVAMLDTMQEIPEEKCKKCLLEWLKQPADGGESG